MSKTDSGLFSGTKGAQKSKIFTAIYFEGTVKVDGEMRDVSRKVYQRNDIDYFKIDPATGLTNLQRMQKGKPPIGNDGNPIQLHHVIQIEKGSVVEIRETTHQEYYHTLHGLVEHGGSFRNDPILSKQFNNFRTIYWKWRAKQIMEGRKS